MAKCKLQNFMMAKNYGKCTWGYKIDPNDGDAIHIMHETPSNYIRRKIVLI